MLTPKRRKLKTLSPLECIEAGLDPSTPVQVLDVVDMAALAGVSKWTIYHWRDEAPDRLPPSMKIGGRVYFAAVQVTRWRPPPRESRRGKWPRQRVSVKDLAASAIERAKRNSIHK